MAKTELIESVEFSYDLVEKDQAEKLRYCAREINKLKEKFAVSAMGIGEMLCIAHDQLANYNKGTFVKWVQFECGFSTASAYNYMSAFKVFGSFPKVGNLEDSAMYVLASKDTPEKARKEVLKLAEKGARITHKQANEIIKKHSGSVSPSSSSSASPGSTAAPEPPKPEPTKEELLKLELKKVRSYAEYLQRGVDDLNHIKRNTVIHPQLIKLCGQILEGLERW